MKDTVNKIFEDTYILNKYRRKKMEKYKVWDCKIVIAGDSDTPSGFDSPPRMAAEHAVESAGFEVLANFSGWGGKLDEDHIAILERMYEEKNKFEEVEIELEDEAFMALAKMAHEKDITFNELCNIVIKEKIEELESKKEA